MSYENVYVVSIFVYWFFIIGKDGPCVNIRGKNRKFSKDEVIHFLKYTAAELENSNSCDFERFEAVLDNDNQHYYGENNYGRTF